MDAPLESYLEGLLGELQDKKTKIEDMDMPLREMAENVLQIEKDGYANSQIASFQGIFPVQVSRILKERERWRRKSPGPHVKALRKIKIYPGI